MTFKYGLETHFINFFQSRYYQCISRRYAVRVHAEGLSRQLVYRPNSAVIATHWVDGTLFMARTSYLSNYAFADFRELLNENFFCVENNVYKRKPLGRLVSNQPTFAAHLQTAYASR